MKSKKGISLIVLIVTIIVIIILAAAVILTLSKNNPIESAREATFKEDVRAFQDELALSISKEYTEKQGQRDEKITASDFDTIKKYIPSFTEKYEGKFVIENDKLVGTDKLSEKEVKWSQDLSVVASSKAPVDTGDWDDAATNEKCFYWDGTTITGFIPERLSGVTKVRIPTKCTAIRSDYAWGGTEDYRSFVAGITTVEIPDTVTEIGKYAFHNFKKLTTINLPNSIISIDERAFDRCESLVSITIPESVTSIGINAFVDCSNLTSITIPESVTNIATTSFNNTAYYNNNDNWENSVLYINNHLIASKENISGEYIIKPGTKTLADFAFFERSNLTSITIPESVTSIGEKAFYACNSLNSINVDKKNTVYDSRNNCNAIINTATNELIFGCNNTVIPEGITRIGDLAFYGYSSLTNITIPESVTSIGEEAFRECSSLRSIIIPNNVTSIGYQAFYKCGILTINCRAETKPSGWDPNWAAPNIQVNWGYTVE